MRKIRMKMQENHKRDGNYLFSKNFSIFSILLHCLIHPSSLNYQCNLFKKMGKWRKKIPSQIITLVISAVLILICCHWILLVTLFNWKSHRILLLLEGRFFLRIRKTVEDWNCKILEERASERIRNHVDF